MKNTIVSLAFVFALINPVISQADYWTVSVKYWCGWQYVTATYKYRNLKSARQARDLFRGIPKYKNTWIRFVNENRK